MAVGISASTSSTDAAAAAIAFLSCQRPSLPLQPNRTCAAPFSLAIRLRKHDRPVRNRSPGRLCMVMNREAEQAPAENKNRAIASRVAEKLARKQLDRQAYLVAAIMSSLGISSMAATSVYYRFSWQMEGGEFPILEMFGTVALSVGAAVGMEFWARWAHRELWHASLWHMHESHHRPREGPFELNDVFVIINAIPAMALLLYGFLNRGLLPGLCFGAGLGITMFGMAYMFVHDGLVHRRFPVGPIANVPYLRKVAAAHQVNPMKNQKKFAKKSISLFLMNRGIIC
ncbi:beta-carotene hydroxylase 2, chloroplastic-like isoform X2 [Rhodamnia argentea]|uniref:beta-carotene 3-hydroxylase n=1 Tax=Rhodamnia argentea TaxID=178133 RepID=A0ABM3HWC0_9MYRT|nr:beta-carotene hydroxylase 2, chloroplastic-like isoform X2 [Rhodamnia argentea]